MSVRNKEETDEILDRIQSLGNFIIVSILISTVIIILTIKNII